MERCLHAASNEWRGSICRPSNSRRGLIVIISPTIAYIKKPIKDRMGSESVLRSEFMLQLAIVFVRQNEQAEA